MRRVVDHAARAGMILFGRRTLDEKLMWARGPVQLLLNLSDLVWPADDGMTLSDRGRLYLKRLRLLRSRRVGVWARSPEAAERPDQEQRRRSPQNARRHE